MPLINVSPPKFARYGIDAIARTVAYLYTKLPPSTTVLIRDGKIFLDMSVDRLQGRTIGEAWRAELAALAEHAPNLCSCGCGADLVIGECKSTEHGTFLTAEESSQVWDYAQCRYRGHEQGQGAALIDVVKKVRIRTGLGLADAHRRVIEVAELMMSDIKAKIPGGLTVDDYKFIERTIGNSSIFVNTELSDLAEAELTRLAIEVGQRIGLEQAFAHVYAYAEFVRRHVI